VANYNPQQTIRKRPGRKKKPKITPKQEKFVQVYVDTGDKKKALAMAGYVPEARPDICKSVQFHIEEYKAKMEKIFMEHADEMQANMYDLATTAKSENVKFQATKDLLDRAGLAPVNRSQVENYKYISPENRITQDLIGRFIIHKDKQKDEE